MIGQENVIVQAAARPERKADGGGFKNAVGPDGVGRAYYQAPVDARPAGPMGRVLSVRDENGILATVYLTEAEAAEIAIQLAPALFPSNTVNPGT